MRSDFEFLVARFAQKLIPWRFKRGCFALSPFIGYLNKPTLRNGVLSFHGWLIPSENNDLTIRIGGSEFPLPYRFNSPSVFERYPRLPGSAMCGFSTQINWQQNPEASMEILIRTKRDVCFRFPGSFIDPITANPSAVHSVPSISHKEELRTAYFRELFSQNGGHADDYVHYREKSVDSSKSLIKLIAFYLPQFHPIPENDRWWGKGFTEWTNVTKALPQFTGHYQPRLPADLGFYDLRVPEVMEKQIELARHYGIYGFCFHHYWFGGKKLLEKPLQQFLERQDWIFPFCICWANENWTRRWDGAENSVLIAQSYSPDDDILFLEELRPAICDPRYIRINNRPLLIVYRPSLLPDPKRTVERWKQYARNTGMGEIYLVAAQFTGFYDPHSIGFDAAVEFPPHNCDSAGREINHNLDIVNPEYQGVVIDYQWMLERAKNVHRHPYPWFRSVFPGWDNEARKPGAGYTFAFSTPEKYKKWLRIACEYASRNTIEGERIVFLNAWNEWGEGAYLEPDRKFGHAYLAATAEIVEEYSPEIIKKSRRGSKKILYVGHDAHRHGAQLLTLSILQILRQKFGYDMQLILLEGGDLEAEYSKFAAVTVLSRIAPTDQQQQTLFNDLYNSGYGEAICNTTVSGKIAKLLRNAKVRFISLIHELPTLIHSYGLEKAAADIALYADKIVFASDYGRRHFEQIGPLEPDKIVIRPQGIRMSYDANYKSRSEKESLRSKLGIPENAIVVLSVGYADHRKGVDLIVPLAMQALAEEPNLYFVWVGNVDREAEVSVANDIQKLGLTNHIQFVSFQNNVADYYDISDLFLLLSREDPYPSVLLEAMSHNLPFLSFENAGGFSDLIESGAGVAVPYLNVAAMADTLVELTKNPERAKSMGELGARTVDEKFRLSDYVYDLLDLLGHRLKRVSVIVPNYNYAPYLEERLDSIYAQTYPIYEVIVLDDGSTDGSLEYLQQQKIRRGHDFKVVANEKNSASPVAQWLKGVDLASGEYIWIAEADDRSDPQFLERTITAFDDPEVVLSYCQSRQITENGDVISNDYLEYLSDIDTEKWKKDYAQNGIAEIRTSLSIKNTIPNVSAAIFRRTAIADALRNHSYELASYRVAGDWLLYIELLRKGNIQYVAEALNDHRRHASSRTISSFNLAHLKEILSVQKYAAGLVALDPNTQQLIRAYDEKIYRQFGLSTIDHPYYKSHPELQELAGDVTSSPTDV